MGAMFSHGIRRGGGYRWAIRDEAGEPSLTTMSTSFFVIASATVGGLATPAKISAAASAKSGNARRETLELPGRLDGHRQLEHRREVGGERLRERARQRVHGHTLAPGAERSGERAEVGIREGRLSPPPLEHPLLEPLDRAVALGVHHQEDDRPPGLPPP